MSALPEDFLQFMRNVYGTEAVNAWLQSLPPFFRGMRRVLATQALAPFENLSFHSVAPAVHADGTPVILETCEFSDEFTATSDTYLDFVAYTNIMIV